MAPPPREERQQQHLGTLCLLEIHLADCCSMSPDRPSGGSLNINKARGVHTAGQLKHSVGGLLEGIHTQPWLRGSSPDAGHALVKAAFYQLIKYLFASVTFRISHHGHDFGCGFPGSHLDFQYGPRAGQGGRAPCPPLSRLSPALLPFRRFVLRKGGARETSA